ncbi:MAG: tripartite tricarboxylate transporter TctB family protein [Deltaproteobacteria bacterium]|jgi:hypothetical protein|nr:tripartite tricarboxylate transporter TctB family protein [Deltaproteobacteria bacterium]
MTRKKRDNLVSGGIILFSVFVLAWVIPNFTPPYPGYGVSSALLPNVVFGLILALSLLSLTTNIISDFRNKSAVNNKNQAEKNDVPVVNRVHLWHLMSIMIPCLLLFPAMRLVGFVPAALVFLILMQYFCGQRKPLILLIVSTCTVGIMYLAMRYGLGVPMP